MNRILAQTIDRLTLTLFSPKFRASSNSKNQNLYLLNDPPIPPRRIIKTPKLFIKRTRRKGNLDIYNFAFPSRIETLQLKNNTVYGQYFKLNNGVAKSTVILLHDIHESRHRYHVKHALNLVKNGHNCVVITMPYHIERSSRRYSRGNEFLSTDLRTIFEALQQATKDVLSLINWLTANGEKKIGLLGIGFGGLIAGLVASATRKINFMILLAPVTNPLQMTGFMASGKLLSDRINQTGLTENQFLELLKPWELENHKPLVSKNRIMIIEAAYNSAVPGEEVEKTWSAWEKPNLKKHYHGQVSMRVSKRILKDISTFINQAIAQQQSAGLLK